MIENCLPTFTSWDNCYDASTIRKCMGALVSQSSQAPDQMSLWVKNLIDGPIYHMIILITYAMHLYLICTVKNISDLFSSSMFIIFKHIMNTCVYVCMCKVHPRKLTYIFTKMNNCLEHILQTQKIILRFWIQLGLKLNIFIMSMVIK